MNNVQKAKLLEMLPKLTRINAHVCAEMYRTEYGERIDWHEFGYYLDELYIKKVLKIISPGGLTEYALDN